MIKTASPGEAWSTAAWMDPPGRTVLARAPRASANGSAEGSVEASERSAATPAAGSGAGAWVGPHAAAASATASGNGVLMADLLGRPGRAGVAPSPPLLVSGGDASDRGGRAALLGVRPDGGRGRVPPCQ